MLTPQWCDLSLIKSCDIMIETNVSGVGLAGYSISIKGEDGTLHPVAYAISNMNKTMVQQNY